MLRDAGQIAQPEQAAVDPEEEALDLLAARHGLPEPDAVLVFAVADRQTARRKVGRAERLFDLGVRQPGLTQFGLVGNDQQFGFDAAAQVDHRHLGQLFDAFGDDLRGEAAQCCEVVGDGMQLVGRIGRTLPAQGEVDVEGRDVRGARLDDPRALQIARQRTDRPVDAFVDLDEEVVDVGSLLEGQTDDAAPLAGFAAQVDQLRELDELLAQGCEDRFVELAGRRAARRNLHRDVGGVDVGHERHGQQAAAHDAQDDEHGRDHRHGDGSVE